MSVYRVIDVIGTITSSWEEAAAGAIATAGGSVRDIRVAEVIKQDIVIGDAGSCSIAPRSSCPSSTSRSRRYPVQVRTSYFPVFARLPVLPTLTPECRVKSRPPGLGHD
jgi:dodecin